jgi:hypothetical protein
MLLESPVIKGVIASSMSLLHSVIASTMLCIFDVGYNKASASKVEHTFGCL